MSTRGTAAKTLSASSSLGFEAASAPDGVVREAGFPRRQEAEVDFDDLRSRGDPGADRLETIRLGPFATRVGADEGLQSRTRAQNGSPWWAT